jgi:hypothetical protein
MALFINTSVSQYLTFVQRNQKQALSSRSPMVSPLYGRLIFIEGHESRS